MENEIQELNQKTNNCVIMAKEIEIKTNVDYEGAGEFLKKIKELKKKVDESFKPIIQKAFQVYKEAVAQSKKHTDPLDDAERILKQKISAYQIECERKRREEQLRLEVEEKKRFAAEAAKIAAELDYLGETEEALEVIQEAIESKPVIIAQKIEPEIKGISTRKVFKWKIKKEQDVKREFLMLDEKKINAIVKSLGKNAENIVGGIQVYEENIISARGM